MPGGVCAVLDYEVDIMADYVSEMAMRVVMPTASVTGAFRKFVSQILTSTRLPSTTILLGLNYLAKRVNLLHHAGRFETTDGQVWQMLTVALMLASKFLDDNTFQNKSWSDVSGINVRELNTMENEWLRQIEWLLYVNLDRSSDYKAWLKNWESWQDNRQRQKLQRSQALVRERLAPLVTSLRPESLRTHPSLVYEGWSPEDFSEPERVGTNVGMGRSAKSYRSRESWVSQYQNPWVQVPVTPPDSGYGTPEYLNSAATVNSQYNDWFSQAVSASNYNRSFTNSAHNAFNSRNSAQYQPFYGQSHFGHSAWDSTVAECSCQTCQAALHMKAAHFGFVQHGFSQAVMG